MTDDDCIATSFLKLQSISGQGEEGNWFCVLKFGILNNNNDKNNNSNNDNN